MNTPSSTQNSATQPKAPSFDFRSLTQLISTPRKKMRFVVDNLLPVGGMSVWAGKPKAGKSTLARQLAVSVATGADFLDRKTVQGTVLYFALEEIEEEVTQHLLGLGAGPDVPIMTWCQPAPENALARLASTLEAMPGISLVIIDPLFRFIRLTDGNDYCLVTGRLEPLLTLARKYGVHILAVHHNKKTKQDDAMDGVLGSTAISAAVDTIVSLDSVNGIRSIQSRQRYGVSMEETVLAWDAEKRELSIDMTREEADKLKRGETESRVMKDIILYVKDNENCLQQDLFDVVKGNATTVKRTFRSLVDSGVLSESGAGTRGDPYRYQLASVPVEKSQTVTQVAIQITSPRN